MWYKSTHIFLALLAMSHLENCAGVLKFTYIECKSLRSHFVVKKCVIEAVDRTRNSVSIDVALINYATDNITVDFTFFKKSNSWKKFMFDAKNFNFCQFLKNPKKYPYYNMMYNVFKPYINVNHSCPLNHDLIMDRMIMTNDTVISMIPTGEYAAESFWYSYGEPSFILKGRVIHYDYRKNW